MRIINLNANTVPSEEDILFALNKAGDLKMRDIPVYLVDSKLMDKIYPPEKRQCLNPECLRNVIQEELDKFFRDDLFGNALEKVDRVWRILEECKQECSSLIIGLGVYLPIISHELKEFIENYSNQQIKCKKCIFICPDRIKNVAENIKQLKEFRAIYDNKLFQVLFTAVFIHELAHAFMDFGGYTSEYWTKVIEESLANAFVYKYLVSTINFAEGSAVEYFMCNQPPEYRGYRLMVSFWETEFHLKLRASSWRKRSLIYPPLNIVLFPIYSLFPNFPSLEWFIVSENRYLRDLYRKIIWHLPHPWDEIFEYIYLGKKISPKYISFLNKILALYLLELTI